MTKLTTNRMTLHAGARNKGLKVKGIKKVGAFVVAGAITLTATNAFASEDQPTTVNSTNTNQVYVVKSGDTFFRIAKNHGISVDRLKDFNPDIKDISRISAGDKIYFSKSDVKVNTSQTSVKTVTTQKAKSISATEYVVKEGDTVYNITKRFGISKEDFRSWNPLVHNDIIYIDQTVKVSGAASSVKAVEKNQQQNQVVQKMEIQETEGVFVGAEDDNTMEVQVEPTEDGKTLQYFYAGGQTSIQNKIRGYVEGDVVVVRYYKTAQGQLRILSVVRIGNQQVDNSVYMTRTFVSMDSKFVKVKEGNNVVSYKISSYLASRNLHFNANSQVDLTGVKTPQGTVIENIS